MEPPLPSLVVRADSQRLQLTDIPNIASLVRLLLDPGRDQKLVECTRTQTLHDQTLDSQNGHDPFTARRVTGGRP